MTWWARSRRVTTTVLLTAVLIPLALAALTAVDVIDLWQFATLGLPAVVAWSVQGRDDARETRALRAVWLLDAAWVALCVAAASAGLALALLVVGGPTWLWNCGFLIWHMVFTAGASALLMRWISPATAVSVVAVLTVALYVTRYVFGPTAALIHRESPPTVAASAAVVILAAGVVSLAVRRER